MSIKRINPSLIKVTGASDGDFLVFDSANNSVEFRAGSNAWTNANDYATYSTLIAAVNSVQDNVASSDNNAWVNANDFATYTTVTALIDTVQSNLTSVISSAPTALDTLAEIAAALENDANLAVTLTNSIGTVSANVDTNTTAINLVQSNLSALPDSAANDYSTYTTVTGLIDTVQDNISSLSSNTQAYVGSTLVSNTALILEAGDGISLNANTTSQSITLSTSMSNITSQVITADGSANSFTLIKEVANSNMIFVSYNGLLQDPLLYTISTTSGTSTLTLANTDPLDSGDRIEVRYVDLFQFAGTTSSSGGGGGGSYTFQGTSFGYNMSGEGPTSGNVIDKHSFTSDGSSADVGDLTQTRWAIGGQTSSTHGYASGGISPTAQDTIDKFPFSSDTNATDVGELSKSGGWAGQSSSTHGYHTVPGISDNIIKFTFSSDSGGTSIGNLSQNRLSTRGQNSDTHGYTTGGNFPSLGSLNTIDKFPFSSDTNATDVGELTTAGYKGGGTGQSSDTHGYSTDNRNPSVAPTSDVIEKFPFASDTSATDVGELSRATAYSIGTSSTTSGYASGGDGAQRTIEKFPFASDTSAANIGNRTVGYGNGAGAQY